MCHNVHFLHSLYIGNIFVNVQVCLVIDKIFDVSSKIIHIPKGKDIAKHLSVIRNHFEDLGSPVMMGGDQDASSKGVFGVATTRDGRGYLLIIDPHYYGKDLKNIEHDLHKDGWVQWKPVDEFVHSSFYNLCLPQCSTDGAAAPALK